MRATLKRNGARRPFPLRGLSVAALTLALAVPAALPQAASALNQTFWAQGTGDFGANVVEPGGGRLILSQVTDGVVKWKDQSPGHDLAYTVSTGQQPTPHGDWLVLTVGESPTDVTLEGSDFRTIAHATFTVSVQGHGRVGTLHGTGSFGVGDDGQGGPIIQWPYQVMNVKVGEIVTEAVTLTGQGFVFGDANTLGQRLGFRGEAFGGGRFIDSSASQDMVVRCRGRGVKRAESTAGGKQVVRCLGSHGRATVSGSNVHFQARAGRLVAKIPAGIAGHLRGTLGERYRGLFSPPTV